MSAVMQEAMQEAGLVVDQPMPEAEAAPKKPRRRLAGTSAIVRPLRFTATLIRDVVKAAEVGAATKPEATAIGRMFKAFKSAGTDDVKTATKDYVGDEGTEGYKTRKVRASEVRQIYGAWRYCHIEPKGYWATVKAAREALKAARRKWDGSKLLDDAAKKAKEASKVDVEQYAAGRTAYHDALNRGASEAEASDAEAQARLATAESIKAAKMAKFAKRLAAKLSNEELGDLIDALHAELQGRAVS